MKRLMLLAAGAALIASPALAQMNMNMPGMKMSAPKKKVAAKKQRRAKKSSPGAKGKRSTSAKSAKKASTKNLTAHHHGSMGSMPGMNMPPGSAASMPGMKTPKDQNMQNMPGMPMPRGQTMTPGMQMPPGQSMQNMPGMTGPEPPVSPPPAAALQGPENAADTVYGTAAMQASRTFLLTKEHGGMTAARLLVDQLETRVRKGRDGYFLNAEAWYGSDIDKLWLKSEIEGDYGRRADQLELQALWSHAIDPWFDFQAGVRFDGEPLTRGRLVVGVEGLAPYRWEVEASAFISTRGDISARTEAYHDIRMTQKLFLQPRAQLDFALRDIPEERIGSGLSKLELGARLRYQFVPNFGPYIGVVYERAIGRTERFVRADGESPGGLQFTVGLRTWF